MDTKSISNIKIISEKIESINIKDIIQVFYSLDPKILISQNATLVINHESQEAKNLGLTKDLCSKLYAKRNFGFISIKYNGIDIPNFYKTVEIENLQKEKEIYEIYRYETCKKIIKEEKKFVNPLIIDDQKILNFSSLKTIFYGSNEKFKIIDKEVIDYEKNIFNNKKEITIDNIKGISFSENFNYYFKYPDKDEIFIYNYDSKRTKLIKIGEEDKIKCICGNFGIGKSTSLLAAKLAENEIIYLNLKSLMKNNLDIYTWKYKLLLKEIAYSFKGTSNYQTFKLLKEKLENILQIWESIIEIVKFTIENKIKSKIILDQYKEKYDKDKKNLQKIINLINADSSNKVRLIISSSINNKDVRNSLLKSWFPEYDIKMSFHLNYIYFDILFDTTIVIENDKSLSDKKKAYIRIYFNNIPRFYYDIKYIEDNKLEEYRKSQYSKILDKINSFYEEDINKEFLFNYYEILLNNRQKIGVIIDDKTLFELLRILPLKYFTFNNQIINFYFPLVEGAFDQYLSNKICMFLKGPLNNYNAGFIGDMLEYILLNDLKNNIFDKFDDIIIVEEIWDLKLGKDLKINNIEQKDILILQSESKAKYLDFAILNKSNNLILFQCKKALSSEPDNYITKSIINQEKNNIHNYFYLKLKADIKKIYLIYITGVSCAYDEKTKNQKLRPWGSQKSETFDINKKISKNSESELIFYDPLDKKFI